MVNTNAKRKKNPLELLVRLLSLLKPQNNSMYLKHFLQTEFLLKLSNNLCGIQNFQWMTFKNHRWNYFISLLPFLVLKIMWYLSNNIWSVKDFDFLGVYCTEWSLALTSYNIRIRDLPWKWLNFNGMKVLLKKESSK